MNKIDTWLKENHKEIYDEYVSSLDNKRERERVILKVSSNDTYKKTIGNDDTLITNPFDKHLKYNTKYNIWKFIWSKYFDRRSISGNDILMMYGIAEDNSNSINYTRANTDDDVNYECYIGTLSTIYVRTTKYSTTKDSIIGAYSGRGAYGESRYTCYGLRPSLIYKE